jgi:hypothetical protein
MKNFEFDGNPIEKGQVEKLEEIWRKNAEHPKKIYDEIDEILKEDPELAELYGCSPKTQEPKKTQSKKEKQQAKLEAKIEKERKKYEK